MKQKLGFFASRWGIIVVGALIGIIAVYLQKMGNPANMGICMACFLRDVAGALGLHRAADGAVPPARDTGAPSRGVYRRGLFRGVSVPHGIGPDHSVRPGDVCHDRRPDLPRLPLACALEACRRRLERDRRDRGADCRYICRRSLPEERLFPRQEPARKQPAGLAHPPGGGLLS